MKYRAEIDGLRALAVVPVILFHAGFELFSGGFVGVDVFFVISGYLITTILIEDLENNRFSIIKFYERRARRILPALFFVILVCILFAWFWMLPSQMKDFSKSLVAVSLFASNILFWRESGYFAAAAEEKPLLHTWSLAVEEQYYVLFPIFLILAWRFGKNRVFWVIVIMAAISLFLSELGWRNKPTANFYLAPTRAWELFAGSIAAFVVQKNGVQKNNSLALLGLSAIVLSVFAYDESTPFPSAYALVPVLGVVLLVLYADKETIAAKILSTKTFVGIGLISYSAYLWHQPLFAFARIKFRGEPSNSLMLILSAMSIFLAIASWKYVESPFRNKMWISRNQIFATSAALAVALIVFGVTGQKTNGFENLITSDLQQSLLRTAVPSPKRSECHTEGANFLTYDESCEYFEGDTKIAIFGDSHTVELSYAFATRLKDKNIGIKQLSFSGCMPAYGISIENFDYSKIPNFEHCHQWTKQAIDGITGDSRIETVIISYRIAKTLYGLPGEDFYKLVDDRGNINRNKLWGALKDMIHALDQAGKKTIFVIQSPELPRVIGYLIPKDSALKAHGVNLDWWNRRMEYLYEHIDEIETLTDVFDPAQIFCDNNICYAADTERAFYFDDHHLSVEGAEMIADRIIKQYLSNE